MSTETNKELVRRFFGERWNYGNLDVYDELLAPSLDIEAENVVLIRLRSFQQSILTS